MYCTSIDQQSVGRISVIDCIGINILTTSLGLIFEDQQFCELRPPAQLTHPPTHPFALPPALQLPGREHCVTDVWMNSPSEKLGSTKTTTCCKEKAQMWGVFSLISFKVMNKWNCVCTEFILFTVYFMGISCFPRICLSSRMSVHTSTALSTL